MEDNKERVIVWIRMHYQAHAFDYATGESLCGRHKSAKGGVVANERQDLFCRECVGKSL